MNQITRDACRSHLAAEVLQAHGMLRLRVTGYSMLPTLWPGDTVCVESSSPESIQVCDIALYRRGSRFFVHRVIAITKEDGLITRGDCMPQNDSPVAGEDLLGRVIAASRDGVRFRAPGKWSLASRVLAKALSWDLVCRLALRVRGLQVGGEYDTQSITA